ncbi:MAG: glycoprotease, partial [Verrucomicrobiaceae bacterium]|nr:glycoprotease [Verrucomicrobiaceae bacterium]
MDIGFLFDWDGVVIDSHRHHEESWEVLAEEIGHPLPEGFMKTTFGMRNESIFPLWLPHLLGDKPAMTALADRKEDLYRELLHSDGIEALPGVKDFLKAARAAGIPACVGTSTPRKNVDVVIELAGLQGLFDAIVSADDVRHGKPDPEVFLKGAQKLGRQPERCVVFEDAFVGIEAGKSGGMKVVGIATTHPIEKLTQADIALHDLTGVNPLELVKRLGL